MKTQLNRLGLLTLAIGILHIFSFLPIKAQQQKAHNPIIYADVPDLSIIRVGNIYYNYAHEPRSAHHEIN